MKQILIRCHVTHKEFYKLTPSEVRELFESWKIDKGFVEEAEEKLEFKDPVTPEEEVEARLQCDRMVGTLRSMCKR